MVGNDREKLITFVNTTKGEVWVEDQGERVEWETLYGRREIYHCTDYVPEQVLGIFVGIDTQDDRYEVRHWGIGAGEEKWLLRRAILTGDPASVELRRKVGLELNREFKRPDGTPMRVERACWDAGGHYSDEVAEESKKHGVRWVIPIFGASTYGKPIANFPRRRKNKIYKTEVGTDNAKELIYGRLNIVVPQPWVSTPGCIHFPLIDWCDEDELKQITAERKKPVMVKGKREMRWDSAGRRNEALDCLVYALAALRISQTRFGFDLEALERARLAAKQDEPIAKAPPPKPEKAEAVTSNWLQTEGNNPWL